jgi:ribosomal protein S18 acetylase RimI-like enzyme
VNSYTTEPYKIRKLDIRFDQSAVADLIESSFGEHLDPDGLTYIKRIRQAAKDRKSIQWLQGSNEMLSYPLYGFVCETDKGEIIGNLSLIPFERNGRWIYLIANVAVAENWRRKGIARKLTTTTLTHLSQQGVQTVWLQVRENNDSAVNLYKSFGFQEFSRRATWVKSTGIGDDLGNKTREITIEKRKAKHWLQHAQLLHRTYPQDVAWNLSLHIREFAPGIFPSVKSAFLHTELQHFIAKRNNQVIGFATWQSRNLFSDSVWLAMYADHEGEATTPLLENLEKALRNKHRPITINYPANRNNEAFEASGYSLLNTLVWMKRPVWKNNEFGGE